MFNKEENFLEQIGVRNFIIYKTFKYRSIFRRVKKCYRNEFWALRNLFNQD